MIVCFWISGTAIFLFSKECVYNVAALPAFINHEKKHCFIQIKNQSDSDTVKPGSSWIILCWVSAESPPHWMRAPSLDQDETLEEWPPEVTQRTRPLCSSTSVKQSFTSSLEETSRWPTRRILEQTHNNAVFDLQQWKDTNVRAMYRHTQRHTHTRTMRYKS